MDGLARFAVRFSGALEFPGKYWIYQDLYDNERPMQTSLMTTPDTKSNHLLDVTAAYDEILIVMHDNPDPDAIAVAWCVQQLLLARQPKMVRMIAGGAIMRAENVQMVRLLQPPFELISELEISGNVGAIVVDCGLGAKNQILTRSNIRPFGVIDHHELMNQAHKLLSFNDVRVGVAAAATIGASYLMEQKIKPSTELATAVWYALRTETCAYENEYTALDRDVLVWATTYGSPALLAQIENAPLSVHYFSEIHSAIEQSRVSGDTAICLLPEVQAVEVVGEVADLLVRCQGVDRVLCATLKNGDLFLSVRTSSDGGNATELLLDVLDEIGSAGGHLHRAGGKIADVRQQAGFTPDWRSELKRRWLESTDCQHAPETALLKS